MYLLKVKASCESRRQPGLLRFTRRDGTATKSQMLNLQYHRLSQTPQPQDQHHCHLLSIQPLSAGLQFSFYDHHFWLVCVHSRSHFGKRMRPCTFPGGIISSDCFEANLGAYSSDVTQGEENKRWAPQTNKPFKIRPLYGEPHQCMGIDRRIVVNRARIGYR